MSLLLGLLFLSGCESGEDREYHGHLYFGAGGYLGKFDLRNGSVEVMTNLGDTAIEELGSFGDEQLLLSVFGPVNRKDTFRLMYYAFSGGGLATLLDGRHGRYLPEPNALVFDDGVYLNVRMYGDGAMEEVAVAQHRFGATARVLLISDTQFLYSIDPEQAIVSFDVASQASQPLGELSRDCGLDGAVWIAERAALLCKRSGEVRDYALMTLDGTVQRILDIRDIERFRALAYLPDQDAVVLTERWKTLVSGRTRHAVWVYDLENDQMVRVVKSQRLGTSVVYRPN
jgi:hypothetical protein